MLNSPQQKNVLRGNKTDQRLFSTMFETSVLAAISGETASFPQTQCEVYGKFGGEIVGWYVMEYHYEVYLIYEHIPLTNCLQEFMLLPPMLVLIYMTV